MRNYQFPNLSNKKAIVKKKIKEPVGFRYRKKHFVKIVTSLVTVLLKTTSRIYIYFVFTKNPLL